MTPDTIPTERHAPFPKLILAGIIALTATPALASDEDPATLELEGVVRDFREKNAEGGHPDFERRPDRGFGHYCGNIDPQLGENRKPVFTGEGFKLRRQYKDAMGRPICYTMYEEGSGDARGNHGPEDQGGIESAATFQQWFTDVPGVNLSQEITLTFQRQEDGTYVFDDKLDPMYQQLGGFFPIESQLFGNPGGSPDRNFHFTLELHTEFTYQAGTGQVFRFIGDDDVWVFIDDQLVIDLGGVHGATEQYVDLDRLGLKDGENYTLDFFFAERHRTESNFRCETNLALIPVEVPTVTAAFD